MSSYVSAGEARTEAMVSAAQKDDGHDGSFDAFAEPANLILYNIIDYLPEQFPKTAELRRKAAALKLPGNPLVSCYFIAWTMHITTSTF